MACFHGGIRVYPKINSIILAVTNTNEKDYKSLLYSTEKRTKMPDSV